LTTYPVSQLVSAHFKALSTIDGQALADLAQRGSVTTGPRPEGMLQEILEGSSGAGLLFGVEGGAPGSAKAYLAATQTGNYLHIEEVAVERRLRRRGLGTALIDAAKKECVTRSLEGITLTTDRLLPSNLGFYRALGFEAIEYASCPAHLRDVIAAECAIFRDPSRRTAMIWRAESR